MAARAARTAHYLIADARERAVAPFLMTELGAGRLLVNRQVNTGDYLICARALAPAGEPRAEPRIRACIERKTLVDFAASFKDGRHANIQKMRALRARTGCQLYFVVEGPAFPSPGRRFGRIPYANILSAITHLMVRDSVIVVQTENEAHTAKRLADILTAYDVCEPAIVAAHAASAAPQAASVASVAASAAPQAASVAYAPQAAYAPSVAHAPTQDAYNLPAAAPVAAPAAEILGGGPLMPLENSIVKNSIVKNSIVENSIVEKIDDELAIPSGLTGGVAVPDADAVVSVWARLPGISQVLGKIISAQFSVADIVCGRVTPAQLAALRTATGRAPHPRALASLRALGAASDEASIRVVSGLRGVTPATAELLLRAVGGLRRLVAEDGAAALAAVQLPRGAGVARLGAARADRFRRILSFRADTVRAPLPAATMPTGC